MLLLDNDGNTCILLYVTSTHVIMDVNYKGVIYYPLLHGFTPKTIMPLGNSSVNLPLKKRIPKLS